MPRSALVRALSQVKIEDEVGSTRASPSSEAWLSGSAAGGGGSSGETKPKVTGSGLAPGAPGGAPVANLRSAGVFRRGKRSSAAKGAKAALVDRGAASSKGSA